MSKVIDRGVIDSHEVPWLRFHHLGCDGVSRHHFREYSGEVYKPFILLLIDARCVRDKWQDMLFRELMPKHFELGPLLCSLGRVDRPGRDRPSLVGNKLHASKEV